MGGMGRMEAHERALQRTHEEVIASRQERSISWSGTCRGSQGDKGDERHLGVGPVKYLARHGLH